MRPSLISCGFAGNALRVLETLNSYCENKNAALKSVACESLRDRQAKKRFTDQGGDTQIIT